VTLRLPIPQRMRDLYGRHADSVDRLVLYVGVAAALFGAYTASQTANEAKGSTARLARVAAVQAGTTHTALCRVLSDYERRLAASKAFQQAHPDGGFGFTAAQIQQQIVLQQRTITALGVLKCR
jgi:hypothetical protein